MYRNNLHYVYIKDILNRQKGIYITAQQMKELDSINGDIRVFAGGNTTANIERKRISLDSIIRKPSIIVKSRGNIDFEYYDRPFTHKNELWSYSISCDNVNLKYIYYIFKENKCLFVKKAKANSVKLPQLTVGDTDNYLIPLPSIKVQEEIVEILDSFTNLIDALNEELSLRQKQFEYYREKLLTFDKNAHKKRIIDLLIQPITDGPHETPTFVEKGIPFISAEAIVDNKINFSKKRGFISNEYNDLCCKKYKPKVGDVYMVKSGSTVGKVAILEDKMQFNIWSPLAALRVNDSCLPKYLYYLLLSRNIQEQIKQKCSKGSQPNLSMRVLERFEINVVNYRIQQSIVEKLDAFESLISSLKEEIALRQKQYEYYREKLLTFN